jgi:hypothetical protein
MKVKINIKTPKGQASKVENQVEPFLIGPLTRKRISLLSYVSDEDDEIFWEIEGEARFLFKITRNVAMFDSYIDRLFNNVLMKRTMRKELTQEQQEEFRQMLKNQTKIKVIKEADASELVELNKTFWDRMKERFKKKN